MQRSALLLTTLLCALAALALLLLPAESVDAKEELVTLPNRDRVTLTIYDPVDLTFVEEERTLTFSKGENRLQFSWSNTLIDPTSVTFQTVSADSGLEVLDTTYPAESDEMLIWTIEAEKSANVPVKITYFTSGISWQASYKAMLNTAGDRTQLTGYVTVNNTSGEEYENARVRLIIGQVNLVEKIRDLAKKGKWEQAKDYYGAPEPNSAPMEDSAPGGRSGGARGGMPSQSRAKRVVKESVGEYFVYEIEGTETISNGWSKRLLAIKPIEVKTRQAYYYKPKEFGNAFVRTLSFYNTKDDNLGTEPFPSGRVRCYEVLDAGRLSFVGSTQAEYLPIGDEAVWNLGNDPMVTMETKRMEERRENLTFTRNRMREYLSGFDMVNDVVVSFANHRANSVEVEIHASPSHPDVDFENLRHDAEKEDASTYKWRFPIDAGSKHQISYTLRFREGTNRK